jgi:hypothetical protein
MLLIIEEQQALQSWRWRLVARRSADGRSRLQSLAATRTVARGVAAVAGRAPLAVAARRGRARRRVPRPARRGVGA